MKDGSLEKNSVGIEDCGLAFGMRSINLINCTGSSVGTLSEIIGSVVGSLSNTSKSCNCRVFL